MYITLSVTSKLPRVALETGPAVWFFSTNVSTIDWSMQGTFIGNVTTVLTSFGVEHVPFILRMASRLVFLGYLISVLRSDSSVMVLNIAADCNVAHCATMCRVAYRFVRAGCTCWTQQAVGTTVVVLLAWQETGQAVTVLEER
jgi:hypothetical protein